MTRRQLTPEELKNRAKRQAKEATFPKCSCGATLGLERVRAGVKKCRGCVPDTELERRDVLRLLEDRALQAKTLDDLIGVVLDLIRRMT